jgi:nicotinamidase-related amidase
MNKILIIIDAQEDFTRGALRNEEAIKALPKISEIVKYAEEHDFDLLYTADCHTDAYLETQEGKNLPVPHCIVGTEGYLLCPEVLVSEDYLKRNPQKVDSLIKHAFGTDEWSYYAKQISAADEVWMCGFCTDICVSANFQIIKAFCPEVPIVVIEDACAGVTPELHEAALKVMGSCQAQIKTWEDLKNEPLQKEESA